MVDEIAPGALVEDRDRDCGEHALRDAAEQRSLLGLGLRSAQVRRLIRVALAVAGAALLGLAVVAGLFVIFDNDNPVHELLTNDRAEARVDAYLGAIMRGDEYTALALWQLDEKVTRAGVPDRRMAVTGVLISARPTAYRVLKTEWWTTCCDPHLVDGPRNAGLARIQVAIDGADTYVFDVLTHDTVYWGDAAGNPPHNWTLRDVYRSGDRPLFFLRALNQGGMLAYHEAHDHQAARSARRAPPT